MGDSKKAGGGFVYEETGGSIVITGYGGNDKEVNIPPEIDGKPVTGIGDEAFYDIGLTGVTIPDSVTSIGKSAFEYNKIENLYLGGGIVNIADNAFCDNKLSGSITIPQSVKTIGKQAFQDNRLTEVIVPDGIDIAKGAFARDVKVTTASGKAPAAQPKPVSSPPAAPPKPAGQKEGDLLFKTENNSVVITGYAGTNTSVQIPSQIQGMPVAGIGEKAFDKKGLTGVTIPPGITSIGESAFSGNKLTSITIPGTVAAIGRFAFGWNDLSSIVIEEGVQSIGESAFEQKSNFNEDRSKVASVVISGSIINIGKRAFYSGRIASITIKSGVQSIGEEAFTRNQLKKVDIPEGVTSIGELAFNENFIESVSLPGSLIEIGKEAFRGNSSGTGNKLSSLTLPANLKILGEDAFEENKLTEIVIPSSVKTIGAYAFRKNQLVRVTIPEGVVTIGEGAFENNQLTLVSLPASVTTIEGGAFKGNKISGDITIPETIKTIGREAFEVNQLSGVEVRGKTKIEPQAFAMNQISKIIIGASVSSIYGGAFSLQKNEQKENALVGATIPESVKLIDEDPKVGFSEVFPYSVYIARGETDSLRLDDANYWKNFEQTVKANKAASMPAESITFHDANGLMIGSASWSDIVPVAGAVRTGSYRGRRAVGDIFKKGEKNNVGQIFIRASNDYVSAAKNFAYITGDRGSSAQTDGAVTVEGIVLHKGESKNIPLKDLMSESDGVFKISAAKQLAEQYQIGTVKIEGGVGVAYNKDGVKVGEVRNAKEYAAVYAGAMLAYVIN